VTLPRQSRDYPRLNGDWQMGHGQLTHESYDQLRDPLVRDLAWIAWSPPLLQPGCLPIRDPLQGSVWRSEPERLWHRLLALDAEPDARAALLSPTSDFRLGTYYERLWHALLDMAPDVQVIARNIRLYQGHRTLGELDLLVETADQAVTHFELAIKFYLGVPGAIADSMEHTPASSWVGPNPRDNLQNKMRRLAEHQLPLGERIDLATERLPRPQSSCAWLQGQVFFPRHQTMAPPVGLATPDQNYWMCSTAWGAQDVNTRNEWAALPHKRWLMPPGANEGVPETENLREDMPVQRAQMLVRKEDVKRNPLLAQRMMVMPDDWPRN
jgi:uncharacterized protein